MNRHGTCCRFFSSLSKPSSPQMKTFWPLEGDATPLFPAHGPFPVPCAPTEGPHTRGGPAILHPCSGDTGNRGESASAVQPCEHAHGPEVRGQSKEP